MFTGTANFQIVGEQVGIIGAGNISADTAPLNPNTGNPYCDGLFQIQGGKAMYGRWTAAEVAEHVLGLYADILDAETVAELRGHKVVVEETMERGESSREFDERHRGLHQLDQLGCFPPVGAEVLRGPSARLDLCLQADLGPRHRAATGDGVGPDEPQEGKEGE